METALLCHDSSLTFVPHSKSNFYFLMGESFKGRRWRPTPTKRTPRGHVDTSRSTIEGRSTPGRQTPVRVLAAVPGSAGCLTPTTDTNDETDDASRVSS